MNAEELLDTIYTMLVTDKELEAIVVIREAMRNEYQRGYDRGYTQGREYDQYDGSMFSSKGW